MDALLARSPPAERRAFAAAVRRGYLERAGEAPALLAGVYRRWCERRGRACIVLLDLGVAARVRLDAATVPGHALPPGATRLVARLVAEYQGGRAPALGERAGTVTVGDLPLPVAHDLARQLALLLHTGQEEAEGD